MNTNLLNMRFRLVGRGLLVLFLCLLCSVPAAMAQRPGGQDMAERMKAQVDEVVKALSLKGEKEVQVRSILEKESEERASIMEGFQGQDRNARQMIREEMSQLGERTSEKIAAVLSEEEMEKYKKVQAEIQERRRAQFGGRRGGGQPRIN